MSLPVDPIALSSPSNAGRALVVDDEARNRELIRDTLESRGYVVEEAGNGAEALARIEASPPDVVLLDVAMPGMDGLEMCRRLKANPRTAALPVILITAHVDRRDRLAGIDAGANDYLTKPVDLQDLVLRVRNAVFAKRLHDQVTESHRQLQELERLRDSLTHMVIHDLRSPLAVLMMGVDLFKHTAGSILPPAELRNLEHCETSVRTMNEMITSLLDVSRLESGQMPLSPSATPLAPLIDATVESFRSAADRKEVRLLAPDGDAIAFCDGEIVRRVLGNLIGNALKFTPARGEVGVSLTCESGAVRVDVQDTGPGIAPEFHARIFSKFGQVQDRHARLGTGLGLAFCKLAIEAHGGRIGLESAPGNGSRFWFTLPPE